MVGMAGSLVGALFAQVLGLAINNLGYRAVRLNGRMQVLTEALSVLSQLEALARASAVAPV